MKLPGLDQRHRDKDGEISKKYGQTPIGTPRLIYGKSFAAGCRGDEKLSDVLKRIDEPSLTLLAHDHLKGVLSTNIARVS